MDKKFMKDCESICFDCGKPEPKHKTDDGVALCDKCWEKDREDEREAVKILLGIHEEITGEKGGK